MALPAVPKFFCLADVAAKFHVTPRRLRDHLRMHPIGRKIGRQILFTEADVLQLIGTMELVGGNAARSTEPNRRSAYVAHTSDSTLAEALALAATTRPKKPRR